MANNLFSSEILYQPNFIFTKLEPLLSDLFLENLLAYLTFKDDSTANMTTLLRAILHEPPKSYDQKLKIN